MVCNCVNHSNDDEIRWWLGTVAGGVSDYLGIHCWENAGRMVRMKLTEKQKNCPYCHPGSKVNDRECWYHTTLALGEAIDSCTYTELYFDPINRFLEASYEDELFIDINYCPMCGRPLNEEEK